VLRDDHAVLHFVVGKHQDDEDAIAAERDEIDVPERKLLALGQRDDADEVGHIRQQ